jgi:hypothetical protein
VIVRKVLSPHSTLSPHHHYHHTALTTNIPTRERIGDMRERRDEGEEEIIYFQARFDGPIPYNTGSH